jgi:predicted  nucleic acid-binding Zn-ribbon protein
MKDSVLIPQRMLDEIGDFLKKQASELSQARERIAELETACDDANNQVKLAGDVLDLIHDGLVDPLDGQQKLAEFSQSPHMADLIKEAAKLNIGAELLGDSTPSNTSASASPESALFSTLREINFN